MMSLKALLVVFFFFLGAVTSVSAATQSAEFTSDGSYVVPDGVFQVSISAEGNNQGYQANATFSVNPNDILWFYVGGSSSCGGEASYVTRQSQTVAFSSTYGSNELILVAAGGDASVGAVGNGFDLNTANLNSGEGWDINNDVSAPEFVCGGQSWHDPQALSVGGSLGDGVADIRVSWETDCATDYDELKSDFAPVLLPSSSLYIAEGVAYLGLDVQLQQHFYDVSFQFGEQCNGNDVIYTGVSNGCNNDYFTVTDYVNDCVFEQFTDPITGDFYFQGTLRVNASVEVYVAGYQVTRHESSVINWRVELQRTITVNSEVLVINNDHCNTDADCTGGQGCCVEDPAGNTCECTCEDAPGGFSGKYCEVDTEPPECYNFPPVNLYAESERGGCVILGPSNYAWHAISSSSNENFVGLTEQPDVIDNSELFGPSIYNLRTIREYNDVGEFINITTLDVTDINNDNILTFCFEIGITEVSYYGIDAAGHERTCNFEVQVVDKSPPHVDCNLCQAAAGNNNDNEDKVTICHGTASLSNPFVSITINKNALATHLGDKHNKNKFRDHYPGDYADLTIDNGNNKFTTDPAYSNIYLDCNCDVQTEAPTYSVISNSWGNWGQPTAIDPSMLHPSVKVKSADFEPNATTPDGVYYIEYEAVDGDHNYAGCVFAIQFDRSPPTCDGYIATIDIDPANTNYSLPVSFPIDDQVPGLNADISGLKNVSLTVDGIANFQNGDVLYVGYAKNRTYVGTYTVFDNAGNIGTCPLEITVLNPNPCYWPECGDEPPVVDFCPHALDTFYCDEQNDCAGCLEWDEPVFSDDRNVISVDSNYDSGIVLGLGSHDIWYIAKDARGQVAWCNFTVTIQDIVAPIWDNCPIGDIILNTGGEEKVWFNLTLTAYDECQLNTDITYTTLDYPLAAEFDENGLPEVSEYLRVGPHSFTYFAQDDSDNGAICTWTVTVVDDAPPVVTCPLSSDHDHYRVLDPNLNGIVVNYEATAVDNIAWRYVNLSYSIESGSVFPVGTTTVTVTAIDAVGLQDTCSFDVTVAEAYLASEVDAILSKVNIKETSPGEFGAVIEFITVAEPWHRILGGEDVPYTSDINEIDAQCNPFAGNTPCYQTWRTSIAFDSCTLDNEEFVFKVVDSCLPGDCIFPDEEHFITITLSADNYCWQDLAAVVITATMRTTSAAGFNTYAAAYLAAGEPEAIDYEQTVFYNEDFIYPIIEVQSEQVFTSNINIIDAKREYYSDGSFSVLVNSVQMISNYENVDLESQTDHDEGNTYWAHFLYQETSVPLETTSYIKYTATVEVTYDINGAARRMLLQTSESVSEEAQATSVLLPTLIPADDDDGVVVVAVDSCENSEAWTEEFRQSMSQHMHVTKERLRVDVEESANGDECFVQITIDPAGCEDLINTDTVLDNAAEDHANHVYPRNTDGDDIAVFNEDVFFYNRPTPQPTVLLTPESASDDVSNETGEDITTQFDWWVYAVVGAAVGIVLTCMLLNLFAASSKNKKENRYNETDISSPDSNQRTILPNGMVIHAE